MNWQALKDWVSTGVWIPRASCNLACLGLFSYNARDLKTALANCDPRVQDCLLILFPAIPDLTTELVPRLRCVLTEKSETYCTLNRQHLSSLDWSISLDPFLSPAAHSAVSITRSLTRAPLIRRISQEALLRELNRHFKPSKVKTNIHRMWDQVLQSRIIAF